MGKGVRVGGGYGEGGKGWERVWGTVLGVGGGRGAAGKR